MIITERKEVPDIEYQKEEQRLEIYRDQHPVDPRELNSFSTMVCKWSNYQLGDKEIKTKDYQDWKDVREHIMERENVKAILSIYVYEHSGITISTTPFNSPWDSGKAGFIYTTEEQIEELGLEGKTEKELEDMLKDGVETYDHYIRGEVYRFVYYENGDQLDACSGFIGESDKVLKIIEKELGIEDISSWDKENNY